MLRLAVKISIIMVTISMYCAISYYSLLLFFYILFLTLSQISLCSLGCLSCKSTFRTCSACDNGYELNANGICILTNGSTNCAIFAGSSSSCAVCKSTYKLANQTCVKDYSGCLSYSGGLCSRCGYGTVLTNGSCTGTLNCVSYNNSCKNCAEGYLLNANLCYYIQRNCARLDVGSGACSLCSKGLSLVGLSCLLPNSSMPYCYVYDGSGCLVCKVGFGLVAKKCVVIPQCSSNQFLNGSFGCQTYPFGCNKVDNRTFICSDCYNNYQLVNGSCIIVLPNNCNNLTITGQCSNCSQGYFSYQYSCKPVSKFCNTYNSQGQCLTCVYSYFANQAGVCKDPFCASISGDLCLSCKEYYQLQNRTGRCVIADPHCTNATDIACTSCINGYYATTTICQQLPKNCLSADVQGNCLMCNQNYFIQLDRCFQINQNLSNCIVYYQYSSLSQCISCQTGYFVVLGKCVLIPPYCSVTISNGQCVSCLDRFHLQSGRCLPTNSQSNNYNCAVMQKGSCVRCSTGSVLGVNGVCYLAVSNGCSVKETSGVCSMCSNGYIPSRGSCIVASLIDINCKTYTGNICNGCYDGYYLADNLCKLPNSNCQSYSPRNGGCLSCYPGYILTNLQCIVLAKVANCLSYDGRGNCIQCEKGYIVNNTQCSKVNPLCKTFRPKTGECTSCFPGFTVQSGNCIQKSQASWFNPTNSTYVVLQTCVKYSSINGICEQCIAGYFVEGSKCINYNSLSGADPKCKTFQNISYCLQCYPGFTFTAGSCEDIDPLCRTVDTKSGACTSCYEGYQLLAGGCIVSNGQQMDACALMTDTLGCVSCIDNYVLKDGICVYGGSRTTNSYSIPYCQIATNASHCSQCQQGFYALGGSCNQVSQFCDRYNAGNGQCITCKESYVLSNGACVFPAMGLDAFCLAYSGVYCSRCVSGYYLKNYLCQLIDPRCINFNFQVKQCLQCNSGVPLFDICQ